MRGRKAAVLMAGLVVAAGFSAPVADARNTCRDGTTACETSGIVSRKSGLKSTTPPPGGTSVFPWLVTQGGWGGF